MSPQVSSSFSQPCERSVFGRVFGTNNISFFYLDHLLACGWRQHDTLRVSHGSHTKVNRAIPLLFLFLLMGLEKPYLLVKFRQFTFQILFLSFSTNTKMAGLSLLSKESDNWKSDSQLIPKNYKIKGDLTAVKPSLLSPLFFSILFTSYSLLSLSPCAPFSLQEEGPGQQSPASPKIGRIKNGSKQRDQGAQ